MPLAHVNPPRQDRSRRTLERIVGAALAILEEAGPEALTVQAVVVRARSSVGSFYARFSGKDDLLAYLDGYLWNEARMHWDEAFTTACGPPPAPDAADGEPVAAGPEADPADPTSELGRTLEEVVRLLLRAHDASAGPRRLLSATGDGGGRDGFDAFREHVLDRLTEMLLLRRGDIVHPDPELAVRIGLEALDGLAAGRERVGAEKRLPLDVLLREGRALLEAYLVGRAAADGEPDEDDVVDFFDVWA